MLTPLPGTLLRTPLTLGECREEWIKYDLDMSLYRLPISRGYTYSNGDRSGLPTTFDSEVQKDSTICISEEACVEKIDRKILELDGRVLCQGPRDGEHFTPVLRGGATAALNHKRYLFYDLVSLGR